MTQRLSILAASALLGALALPAIAQKQACDASGATMESSPGKATLRHERQIVATVEEVDAAKGHVTLKGPNRTVDLYVEDPEQLKLIKVGDQIEAVYTQAVAVTVEPIAAKK